MTMPDINTEIRYMKGVGEKKAELFSRLGVYTVFDLLNYFPRDYEDRRKVVTLREAQVGEKVCVRGIAASDANTRNIRKGFSVTKLRIIDESGGINVVFYNQKYTAGKLRAGEKYVFFGKIEENDGKKCMMNPVFEQANAFGNKTGAIVPIYGLTAGMTADVIRRTVRAVLTEFSDRIPEVIPDNVRMSEELAYVSYAYNEIHFPQSMETLEIARKRLIFEELFVLCTGLAKLRKRSENEDGIPIENTNIDGFEKVLPFVFTNAQKRVVSEILGDMKRKRPMNRIVQGDVGSGKTAVAAAAAFAVKENGMQTALMAPTEILAKQHYGSLRELFDKLGIKTGLLTGGMKMSEKREIKERLASGEIDVIIGTHAVISDDVGFKNLALIIVDEQHRFGVKQRASLAKKGSSPHRLVMSATPIPRSLALVMYGDLDISVIDELPPGRQKVDTLIVNDGKRKDAYSFIRKQIDKGHQAYIVCPMIDEDESGELRSVEKFAEQLSKTAFSGKKTAFLHGKMKPSEKEKIMLDFSEKKTDAIVSTTVIEVGVNVPNATVMAIENAERFGLSQLHQLRGRVGRGKDKSYCIMFSNVPKNSPAAERLEALRKTSDGFRVSEEDLRLRGPGDFFGTRQHGLPELRIASLLNDMKLLACARNEAEKLTAEDFGLELPEHRELRNRIEKMFDMSIG